jgi:hypothetical protein
MEQRLERLDLAVICYTKVFVRAITLVSSFAPRNTQNLSRQEHAAVTIQKAYRGYIQRKLYLLGLNEDFLVADQQRAEELAFDDDEDDMELLSDLDFLSNNIARQRTNAATIIQRYWRKYKTQL